MLLFRAWFYSYTAWEVIIGMIFMMIMGLHPVFVRSICFDLEQDQQPDDQYNN